MISFKTFLLEESGAGGADDEQTDEKYSKVSDYYQKIFPRLQQTERAFEQVLRASLTKRVQKTDSFKKAYSSQPVIITNIKPLKSVISKVKRGKSVEDIGDMVRGAVLMPDGGYVNEFVKSFVRKNAGIIAKHEIKKFGSDKNYGYYGSQHIDLVINGVKVELQVMTQKLWKMKHYAHKIYTKTRENVNGATESDKIQSKNIFKIGNKPKFVKESDIPDDLDELYEFMLVNNFWTMFID